VAVVAQYAQMSTWSSRHQAIRGAWSSSGNVLITKAAVKQFEEMV